MNSRQIDRLVLRAKTDDAAFAQLANHLDRMIHWVAYKWGPKFSQEQAYQDALIAFWEVVKIYEPDDTRANFKTVATNYMKYAVLGTDSRKSIDAITENVDLNGIEWFVGSDDDAIQHLLDQAEAETLLSLLTDKQRRIIELTYGFTPAGPLSVKEAAAVLGIAETTVGKQRVAAVNRLRREYGLDKVSKLRGLHPEQENEVRARYEAGANKAQLAREYGVSRTTIKNLVGLDPERPLQRDLQCSDTSCVEPSKTKGMCAVHYNRWYHTNVHQPRFAYGA
jgi:RNA polymerase sigma factor (sigma-70 family)